LTARLTPAVVALVALGELEEVRGFVVRGKVVLEPMLWKVDA
jgi:hypothetical protein